MGHRKLSELTNLSFENTWKHLSHFNINSCQLHSNFRKLIDTCIYLEFINYTWFTGPLVIVYNDLIHLS